MASRRITTEDDYLVAGRSLGPVLATFTVFATWFGAESCIAAAGAVYHDGLSGGSADPFGYGICIVLTGLLLAVPLWRLKLTTLADLYRIRYDAIVERLAVVLMVPTSLFWAAAQVRAFGQVLSAASGFKVEIAVTVAAAIVIAYTMFGGLLADAWTDLVQGIALIAGLLAMFIVVFHTEGFAPLAELGPGRLNPLGAGSRPFLEILEEWAIPVLGSLVAAEVAARIIASRSASVARNATVVAGGAYVLIGLMPVLLGLLGSVIIPDLVEPEQVLPALATRYLPTVVAVLFSGALVSAILSTVDSALLVSAGLVSHNIVVQLRPDLTEEQRVLVARGFVAFFGVLSYLMAFRAERIYELVEQASAFGSSGIVVVTLFGLFTRWGDTRSALASLLFGVGTWVVAAYLLDVPYPYLTSLTVATLAYVVPATLASRGARRVISLTVLALLLFGCAPTEPPADRVFLGGSVYTVDAARPTAEAVAVRGDRIVYVGDSAGVASLIGESTEVVDLAGGMLLPGFHDTHVHPVSGGVELGECDLNPAASRDDVVRIVSACADEATGDSWVRGGGFQLPFFPGGAPSRQLLDSLTPDRPAYLSSADGHSAWVNTRALEIAGVTAATADPPPDGVIVRDASGSPQGTLRESAMELVSRFVPDHTDEEIVAGLERGLAMAASYGITTVHEANASEAYLRAYATLESEGRMTARAIVALDVDEDRGTDQVPELVGLRDRYAGRLVRPDAAKIFVDGVIEGQTAALLEPYDDRPGFRGELNLPPDSLRALVGALDDAGFKVHLHAIGDRAIRVGLDAFEAQHARDGGAGPRHIMAHIQLFDPADVPRFAELGVVASFQPLWFYADSYITDLTEPRLGPARSRWLYPARSVVETGAIVAAGSDWSVSSMDPLPAIEVAITRRDPDVDAGPSWIPEERLDLPTMLRAYTLAGAQAGDMEDETGTITVGKSADLVVLDHDLFALPPERISDARVLLTLFEGRVVYRR